LTFGFFHCEHLCHNVIRGLTKKLSQMPDSPDLVFLSLDEKDTPLEATVLHKRLGPHVKKLTLLTASPADVKKITRTLGLEWKRDPVTDDIIHESVVYLVQGNDVIKKISSTDLKPSDLDVGRPPGKFFDFKQFCSTFDPSRSRYGALIVKGLAITSGGFALCLAIFFFTLRRKRS
jgi:hypothetical protein